MQQSFSASSLKFLKGNAQLGTYPYTYARVSVMRSLLLKKEEYHKLMKMNVVEITGYLQGSQYRKEIDELAVRHKGVELMELALNRNLANSWAKLNRISPPSLRALISAYLLRVDIWNVKLLVRAKYTRMAHEQLQSMLLPAGQLDEKSLAALAKKDSVEDVLKSLVFIRYALLSKAVDEFRETKSLAGIENALDHFYYSAMEAFASGLPRQGRLFREFLEAELEASAVMNILRLRRAQVPPKEVEKYVKIPKSAAALARKMISAQSAEDAARLLGQSRFRAFAGEGVREFLASGSLIKLELDFARQMLKRSTLLIHKHPLSVDVILGYMFAKEIEVRNLRLLLKARQLKIDDAFIESQLVIA